MRLYENGHTRANDLEMVDGLWGNRRRKGARSERRLCDGQILVWGGWSRRWRLPCRALTGLCAPGAPFKPAVGLSENHRRPPHISISRCEESGPAPTLEPPGPSRPRVSANVNRHYVSPKDIKAGGTLYLHHFDRRLFMRFFPAAGRQKPDRRNAQLLCHAAGTLALPADQQPAGAADAGDSATNASGGRISRRPIGADAGGRAVTPCGRDQVGNQTLSADGPAG